MDRAVVVHPGLDPGLAQPVSEPVAVLKPGREQVIDAGALRPLLHDHGVPREQLPVVRSAGAPRLVPGVEVLELDSQQCRLEPVEPIVEAELHVLALDPLAEVAQTAEPAGQQRVVGADSAAVSKRAEVLARVEGEAGGGAERADRPSAVLRAGGLGRVLEQQQAVRLGHRLQRVHVARLAVEVHGEDPHRARTHRGAGRVGVDQAGVLQHVAQHRRGADVRDGQGRGDEGVRRDDDLVAGPDVVGAQHERQRRRAGGDADALLDAAVLREFVFKCLDLGAEDVAARIEHAIEGVAQALLDGSVL